jgi:hypothetical protein
VRAAAVAWVLGAAGQETLKPEGAPAPAAAALQARPDLSGVWQELPSALRSPRTLTIIHTATMLRMTVEQSGRPTFTYDLANQQHSAMSGARASLVSHWEGDRLVTQVGNLVVADGQESRYESRFVLYVRPDGLLAEEFIRDTDPQWVSSALSRPNTWLFRKIRQS